MKSTLNTKFSSTSVIIVVSVVIVAGLAFWYWRAGQAPAGEPQNGSAPVPQVDEKTVSNSFGGRILDQTQNPIKDKVPEINPFSNTETNPLKRVVKNPF